MPVTNTTYGCGVCGKAFGSPQKAEACEQQGFLLPYHCVGDAIRFCGLPGREHGRFEGIVRDIIFPLPWLKRGGGKIEDYHPIGHRWEVSYLVGVPNQDESLVGMPAESLYLITTGSVQPKDREFMYPGCEFSPEGRRFAASWEDFCNKVAAENPAPVAGRLAEVTKIFRENGLISAGAVPPASTGRKFSLVGG